MLKVLITGAYSTGKTTLLEALLADLRASGLEVATVPDVARGCPVPLNAAQTEDATLWLLTTQVSREIQAGLGPEAVILCDRGVPDVLAHHLDLADKQEGLVAALNPFLSSWLLTYDLILYSRVDEGVPILPDGVRTVDAAYRSRLAACAEKVVAHIEGVQVLPFGDLERLTYAREAVLRSLERPEGPSSSVST
jgi:nicotinamide riboside kinase